MTLPIHQATVPGIKFLVLKLIRKITQRMHRTSVQFVRCTSIMLVDNLYLSIYTGIYKKIGSQLTLSKCYLIVTDRHWPLSWK